MSNGPANSGAAQYVEVSDDVVSIVDPSLLEHTRYSVAVVGPPGAGKSTLCNTLYHIAFGSNSSFFEPSANPTSFTKGLWVLSKEARMQIPGDINWEVIDMEGFQVDQMSSWKMAMVLCVLAEVVIFCNRDARCDNLFKVALVFEKGRKLSVQLGMKPITSQIFVQVEEGMEQEQIDTVVKKIEEMCPNTKIIPFEIPQLRNKNKRNHEFITFHEEISEAVSDNLVKKFQFSANANASGSKSNAVAQLLQAFNEGDYLKYQDLNAELLRSDLEVIYETEVTIVRNKHVTKALNSQVTSVDMTLEQFMGVVDKFEPKYNESVFYVEGKSDKFIQEWDAVQPRLDAVKIYEQFYKDKMEELVERKEREAMIKSQKEKDFYDDIERAIETARFNLQRYIGILKFSMTVTKNQDEFIENKKSIEERGVALGIKPDWKPFYKYYEHEKECVKGMWEAQINKAKWKAPVSAQGKLKCKNGHRISEDVVCCMSPLDKPDAKGNTVCGGLFYWVDGPEKYAKCRGSCGLVQKMPTNLFCFKCGSEAQCEIRPSNYYP